MGPRPRGEGGRRPCLWGRSEATGQSSPSTLREADPPDCRQEAAFSLLCLGRRNIRVIPTKAFKKTYEEPMALPSEFQFSGHDIAAVT